MYLEEVRFTPKVFPRRVIHHVPLTHLNHVIPQSLSPINRLDLLNSYLNPFDASQFQFRYLDQFLSSAKNDTSTVLHVIRYLYLTSFEPLSALVSFVYHSFKSSK